MERKCGDGINLTYRSPNSSIDLTADVVLTVIDGKLS